MAYTSIDDPEAYFQAVTYTGNGSTQSITLPGSTDMQPDLIWIKERNAGSSHAITDSVRGTSKYCPFVNPEFKHSFVVFPNSFFDTEISWFPIIEVENSKD